MIVCPKISLCYPPSAEDISLIMSTKPCSELLAGKISGEVLSYSRLFAQARLDCSSATIAKATSTNFANAMGVNLFCDHNFTIHRELHVPGKNSIDGRRRVANR
jgi:hypothetical protein